MTRQRTAARETRPHADWADVDVPGGGGGVLPYLGYTGTCHWIGYGFWPLCPEQGIISSDSAPIMFWSCPRQGMFARPSSSIW